jgi:hypothetical protein
MARIANAATDEAVEKLAKTLVTEMEGLDPTEDWDWSLSPELNWERLDERRKAFYRLCVEALLSKEDWVRIALLS